MTTPKNDLPAAVLNTEAGTTPKNTNTLTPATPVFKPFHIERLEASGLTAADGEWLKIKPTSRGFEIPYFDPTTGKPMLCPNGTPYIRTRYKPPLPLITPGRL